MRDTTGATPRSAQSWPCRRRRSDRSSIRAASGFCPWDPPLPMTKHLDRSITSNASDNPSIGDLIPIAVTRRQFLRAGIAGAIGALPGAALLGGCATAAAATGPTLGFAGVAPSTEDRVVVPPGYRAQV